MLTNERDLKIFASCVEEKALAQIDQLTSARFDIRDGKPGLVIPK